jgi:mRNA interferase HigB
VKYLEEVHIVTRRHLRAATAQYPDAANDIRAWANVVEAVRWHHLAEVRAYFPSVDFVDGYVVFNIRHNRYRLITVIHFAKTTEKQQTEGHVYIRSFLPHGEYNDRSKWDRRFGRR